MMTYKLLCLLVSSDNIYSNYAGEFLLQIDFANFSGSQREFVRIGLPICIFWKQISSQILKNWVKAIVILDWKTAYAS